MAKAAASKVDPSGVRDRILASARTEFADHGLSAASVHRIAERAGATAAMINYYYGGKRALYETVIDEAQARQLACLSAAVASGERAGLASRIAVAYFDFLAEERELQRILLREVLDAREGGHEHAVRSVAPLRALLEAHVPSRDRDRTVQFAISLFGAVAGYFLYEPVFTNALGEDALGPRRLAARRRHVLELAAMIEEAMG
jgi:AcrR family transcriptional regulator